MKAIEFLKRSGIRDVVVWNEGRANETRFSEVMESFLKSRRFL